MSLKNIILFILCLGFFIKGFSQYEEEKVLLLTPKNAKVKYWLKSDNSMQVKRFGGITDSTITINDTVYALSDISRFKIKKARYFHQGKKIFYYLHKDDVKYKGRINTIYNDKFIVDFTPVEYSDVSLIGGRPAGLKVVKIVGGTVLVLGTGLAALGVSFIINSQNEDSCGGPILFVLGIGCAAVGTVSAGIGAIPLLIGVKKYDLGYEWNSYIIKSSN